MRVGEEKGMRKQKNEKKSFLLSCQKRSNVLKYNQKITAVIDIQQLKENRFFAVCYGKGK